MGAGAFIEPLVVISLLVGGTLINRERRGGPGRDRATHKRNDSVESGASSPSSDDGLLRSNSWQDDNTNSEWRMRTIRLLGWSREVRTPNTQQFSKRLLSRLLRRLPFLVEVWYWALIYWVYQLGRAFTAVTLVQGTVHTARRHALQLVHLEKQLHVFWEPAIQQSFLQHPTLMHWTNRIYSFIHIPGTILFLIWLFYFTITAKRNPEQDRRVVVQGSSSGSALYQARRRTMAMCNLLAFVVFTAWPCMPPRLLSDPNYNGKDAAEAKSYGFVDTVHGAEGESSVWTQNKFCNQYAAMPSLHFGYSLLIGLTIATIPLSKQERPAAPSTIRLWRMKIRSPPNATRLTCMTLGVLYPATILVAIIATANHFILDAVAGAMVCGVAWNSERVLLNLLVVEDWFLWGVRLHKPEVEVGNNIESEAWIDEKEGSASRSRRVGGGGLGLLR